MKYFLLLLITIYQKFISASLKNLLGIESSCRFYPTCSDYAKSSIAKFGVFRGSIISIERILKCQPFYRTSPQAEKISYGRNF